MLQTCPETLERQEIDVHVEETKVAAEAYSGFATRREPVGGLFHSTC